MAGRIYLANVGANASHGFASPLFADGTFEFLPIPENKDLPGPDVVRYRDLVSYNTSGQSLREFVPKRLWDWPAHSDPEFETYTYGDNCETSPRAASLKRLEPGDFLFFLARMAHRAPEDATGRHGFYLIGFLEIADVLADVGARPSEKSIRRFRSNAHVRRALAEPAHWDRFWVFKGSARSTRFRRAVPVTRQLADRVFSRADGSPWRWNGARTELQVIGSYTRSCRCVIDPALSGHSERRDALWDWVARFQQQESSNTARQLPSHNVPA